MSLYEQTKADAEQCARDDHAQGRHCWPLRHGALDRSAWAKWYTEEYRKAEARED